MLEERFGPQLTIDRGNRLNPLSPEHEQYIDSMSYLKEAKEIRTRLKQAINAPDGLPQCPDGVQNIDQLFVESEKVVHETWMRYVTDLFDKYRERWLGLDGLNEEMRQILSNKQIFEEKMRLYQLGPLEPLRSLDPDGWRMLVSASSERQSAQMWLVNHWSKKSKDKLSENIGMTPDELQLVIEIVGNLGKYFNMAFLKQMELADMPGGSSLTPLGDRLGAHRIYDLYKDSEGDEIEVHTYKDIFQSEFGNAERLFKRFSARATKLLAENRIPAAYKGLPKYLDLLADTYGSDEKNPEKLNAKWESLDTACKDLAEDDCPLAIAGQFLPGVAGDASKADIELRVGFRDDTAKRYEKVMGYFHESTQALVDNKRAALSERYFIPKPQVSRQLGAFGVNLTWQTPADTRKESTNMHYNAIQQEGIIIKPILDQLIPGNKVDDQKYKEAFIIDTGLHELGHGIMSVEDSSIRDRMGGDATNEGAILEEVKTETASFVILRDYNNKNPKSQVNIQNQVMAKIAVLIDYLVNKSSEEGDFSERYYYTGVAIVSALVEKNVLVRNDVDGTYSIPDYNEAVDVIAGLSESIMQEFYENQDSNPARVETAMRKLRLKKESPAVAQFIQSIQNIQTKKLN